MTTGGAFTQFNSPFDKTLSRPPGKNYEWEQTASAASLPLLPQNWSLKNKLHLCSKAQMGKVFSCELYILLSCGRKGSLLKQKEFKSYMAFHQSYPEVY